MTDLFTVLNLFEGLESRLNLGWIAGRAGRERQFRLDPESERNILVGHLNFIRPNAVQVLGRAELDYLASLGKNSYQDAIDRLFSDQTVVVVVGDGAKVPGDFPSLADANEVPLFGSELESDHLVNHLRYFLGQQMAEKVTMHGVFMEVMGIGLLLTGEASIGKSELALELITRGHRLIADDAPIFSLLAPDTVSGSCPEVLREFLEVRGLGILNIRALFGDSAVKPSKYLRLIIRLEQMSDEQLHQIDRLQGSRRTRKLLGVEVPELTLPVAPGRNLAVLVETAARNHILSLKGYESYRDFIHRQQQAMKQEKT